MQNPRNTQGDAYSSQLFRSRFQDQANQPGDGDPDFNDGLLTPRGAPAAYSGMTTGYVTGSYPETMTVDVETDGGLVSGCRIGTPYIGPQGAGQSVMPEPGTQVLLCIAVQPAVVVTCVAEADVGDTAQDNAKIDTLTSGTQGFGGDDPSYAGQGGTNHRNGRTTQLIPGDQVISSTEGNLVGVLRGLTLLKGSELSQIILSNIGGLVRIISNLYQHFHAAGWTQIANQSGKTTARFKFGATAKDNGEVEPVIHLTVGAEGDLLELLVTTEDGEKLARCHVDSQGEISVETPGLDIEVEQDLDIEVDGDSTLDVQGNYSVSVGGDGTYAHDGKCEITANELTLRAGAGGRLQSAKDLNMSVGGRFTQQISGEASLNTGAYSHETQAQDINLSVKAGKISVSGLSLTKTGDVDVSGTRNATLGGKVSTNITGSSVQVGSGTGLPVIRNTDLIGLVDAIFAYLNVAGTSPGGKIAIPAPPAAANPISAAIGAMGSKIVRAS